MSRRLVAVLVIALGAVFFVPNAAQAAFGIKSWEALTCKENKDTPETPGLGGALIAPYPIPDDPEQCTAATESKWYTQAAGQPTFGITDFELNSLGAGAEGFPDGPPAGFIKEIVVDTPEGLGVNPEATPVKCTVAQLSEVPAPTCPATSLVGFNYLTVAAQAPPCLPIPPGKCTMLRVKLPVYNIVPFDGVPSMVGFPTSAPGEPTLIVGDLDPADQHVRFTISDIHAPDGTAKHPPILASRLVFEGKGGPLGKGSYLTMPSNCAGGQTSILTVRAHGGQEDQRSFTTAVGASGCDKVPFEPGLVASTTGATDSPEPATIDVQMPFAFGASPANSHLLKAQVLLPEGSGLNPSVANGLEVCTDGQFGKGTDNPIACPPGSKIGEVEVDTGSLDQPLEGDVYIGEPTSQDSSSGNKFRIFLHAFNTRYGVNVRLIGNVFPNLQTGQLTAVVDKNPQAPFTSFRVKINGGPRGALTSPSTCGPHTTSATYTPWSGTADVTKTSAFTLTKAPDGGPCPATLGERKFTPVYTAKSDNTTGGAYSPLRVLVARANGEQELKVIDVTLPPGLTGKLAGIPYCSDASLTAAAAASGAAEKANPSCSSASQIGTATVGAGSGEPYKADGKAYLAGPYKGAPLSFAVITPAVAGPYDLGTVVLRVPLFVNPTTAQVRADSDVIPDVFGGVKLDIRSITVDMDRSGFIRNPTNCEPRSFTGSIKGGGSNPADPAAFSSYPFSSPFQASNCDKLGYKPKLKLRLYGKKASKRRGHPRIEAQLTAREGDANTARTAVTLPPGTLLDNSHFKTICTRVQLAAGQCPKGAQYGNAKAVSPLLDKPLQGPVYLVSSSDKLPNLVADLRGQVNVQLRGVISTVKGRMKTTFPEVPDVPVRKFTLKMQGGSKGLLINSKGLCGSKKSRQAKLNMKAQNGKQVKNNKLKIQVSCKKKKK